MKIRVTAPESVPVHLKFQLTYHRKIKFGYICTLGYGAYCSL